MNEARNVFIGLDLETTGLCPRTHRILEIGMIHYNRDLEEQGEYQYAIDIDKDLCATLCDDYVKKMHTDNGLFGVIESGFGSALSFVEGDAIRWLKHVKDVELSRMVEEGIDQPQVNFIATGSSVHFDTDFLAHWMPTLAQQFSHRHLDSRTLWLCHPLDSKSESEPTHRALDDIRQSVSIIRTYRDALKGVSQ